MNIKGVHGFPPWHPSLKALIYFEVLTTLALIIGLLVANTF